MACEEAKKCDDINCDFMNQMIDVAANYDWKDLKNQGAQITDGLGGHTLHVFYPFIVNNKAIDRGTEVVVLYNKDEEKQPKKRKLLTAFDQLQDKERKRRSVSCVVAES